MTKDRKIPYGIVNKREIEKARDEAIDHWLQEASLTTAVIHMLCCDEVKHTEDGILIDKLWYDAILRKLTKADTYNDMLLEALVKIKRNL